MLVPAYNEAAGLAASLASIQAATAAFTARGWTTELIVCDNNSTRRHAGDRCRRRGPRRVRAGEPDRAGAQRRRRARPPATGCVFVDADSHPTVALFDDAAEADRVRSLPGRRQHGADDRAARGSAMRWSAAGT